MQSAFTPSSTEEMLPARFYLSPRETWDAMYDDCARATRSIDFEQYILNNDEAGQRFLKLFADKAAQGVRVRLLLDRVGSRSVYETERINDIIAKGGHVHFYGGRSWLNVFVPWRWFPRNHTKVMLIDDRIVYIGSACIEQVMADWRDTQMRFEDILVDDIRTEFQLTWNNVLERKRRRPYYASPVDKVWRYAVNQPRLLPNPIYRELLHKIRKSTTEVILATPYFVPPWPLRNALRRAVKRGVSVKVMISEKSDIPLADLVSRSYFVKLLRHGIQIYLYGKTNLHTKYAVIDEEWATLGSTNMDYLSLLHNREANVITSDRQTIDVLKGHFANDMKECRRADFAYVRTFTPLQKIIGYAGRLMRRFL